MTSSIRIVTPWVAALVFSGLGIGCGGKEGGAGTAESGGSSGSGGAAGGDAASNSAAPEASADAAASIMCGTATCQALTIPMFGNAAPCCPSGETNACGASAWGGCLTRSMGTQDPSCPSTSFGGYPLPGCCAANGLCGTNLSAIGLGCSSLAGSEGGSSSPCRGDSGAN